MPRYKDFTGKNMFGLQVESYAGKSYWNCTCKCGNKMQVRAYELKRQSKHIFACKIFISRHIHYSFCLLF